jgi:hypothetical protein
LAFSCPVSSAISLVDDFLVKMGFLSYVIYNTFRR